MEYILLFQIFLISFLINAVWEMNHSVLYKTCYELPLKKCMKLLTVMSLKDGFWITLFYLISFILFSTQNPFINPHQIGLFILLALSFSFIDEKISIKKSRWKYAEEMPTFLGVGITPLAELAVTGVLSFFIVFYIF